MRFPITLTIVGNMLGLAFPQPIQRYFGGMGFGLSGEDY